MINISINAVSAQEYVTIEYSDNFELHVGQDIMHIPMLSKAQRVNRNASTIVLQYEDNINDNIIKAAEYAASVWESYIQNSVNLYIEVKVANINEDIRTAVQYRSVNNVMIPLSLIAYKEQNNEREHLQPDGIITINGKSNWDFNLDENTSSEGINLAYGILRSIARIMGFGSNVIMDENGNYKFSDKRCHSIFNSLVVNSSGKKLSELSIYGGRPSGELKSYVEDSSQNFWICTTKGKFQLASPPYSQGSPPFVFLEDNSSLMRSNLYAGDYILTVDEATQIIINELGWNTKTPERISIHSDDVPDSGVTSAYTSHTFRIESGGLILSNPTWTLSSQLKDGSFEFVTLSDNNLSCIIPPISDETKYKISQDGYIKATLNFSCSINGQEVKALPFTIYLELKPCIEYATIENIVDNSPYASYDVYYKVKYRGAERIKVSVEQEYSSKIKTSYIKEPYIAHGMADHISSPHYAWIDFTVENEYGRSVYTIELQPYGVTSQRIKTSNSRVDQRMDVSRAYDYYEMYDIHGRYLMTTDNLNNIDNPNSSGIIIVRHIVGGNIVKTFKKRGQICTH